MPAPRLVRLALCALFSLALAAPAVAQSKTVPANKTTEIDFAWAADPRTCGNLSKPNVRVRQPENGRVTTKWVSRTMTGARGRAARCNGKRMRGTAIYYTPKRGYRGADSVSVSLTQTFQGRRRSQGGGFRVQVR